MASVKRYGERRSRLTKHPCLCVMVDTTLMMRVAMSSGEQLTQHSCSVQRAQSWRLWPFICWAIASAIERLMMSQYRVKNSISQSEEVKSKVSYQKKRTRYYKRSDGQSLRYLGAFLLRPSGGVSIAMPRREQSNLDRGWTCQWFRHQRLVCKSDFREPKILISLVRVPSLASVLKIS